MEEKREGLKTEDLETEEERFGMEEGRLDTDGLKTEKLDPQRFICWVGQHPHPILRSAGFFHRRLEAESNADRRDASFGYLQQEGDKADDSCMEPLSNLRSTTYIPNYPLTNHACIKLIQEAKSLAKIAEGHRHLLSEATATLSWCTVLGAPSASSQRV